MAPRAFPISCSLCPPALVLFSASVRSHVSLASSWSNLPRHRARISGLLGDFRPAEDGGLDHHAFLGAMYLYTGLSSWYSAHLLTVDELREIYKLSVLHPSFELHCLFFGLLLKILFLLIRDFMSFCRRLYS